MEKLSEECERLAREIGEACQRQGVETLVGEIAFSPDPDTVHKFEIVYTQLLGTVNVTQILPEEVLLFKEVVHEGKRPITAYRKGNE